MILLEPLALRIPREQPTPEGPGRPPAHELSVYCVRVQHEGAVAYGEAAVSQPQGLTEGVGFFSDLVAHGDPLDHDLLWQRMGWALREDQPEPAGEYAAVMSAIDLALWDLAGRLLGVPCYRLLGGAKARKVDCYAVVAHSGDPSGLTTEIRQLKESFGSVQVQLGGRVEEDLAGVRAARRAVGDNFPLRVAAGGAYDDLEAALTVGRELDRLEAFWYQEPLPAGRWSEYAQLRRDLSTPLVGGSTLFGLKPFARALEAGALDVVALDLRLCGGMSAGRRLADLAWLEGAFVTLQSGFSPLALLASAHLSVALLHAGAVQVQVAPTPLRELLIPGPVFKDGFLLLPEGPGLGAQVVEEFVNRYQVELPES